MAAVHAPPHPTSSPWLHLAGPLGKFGAAFLLVSSFVALFAPIVFLLSAESMIDASASSVVALFSDPARVLAISDFIAVLGVVILAGALVLVLLALVRGDRRVSLLTFALGCAVLLCLVSWVSVMLYAQGQARGTILTVDAAAATGGWGVASLLLLVASLAYMSLTLRVENGEGKRSLTSFWWPAYGAVNVLGSVAIAGFFAGSPSGAGRSDALSLGLVLKVTLIPMLGVMAYGDLKDRFPRWARVPLMEPPKVPAAADREAQEVPPPPPEVDVHGPLVTVVRTDHVPASEIPLPPPPAE